MGLDGVKYEWKNDEYPAMNFPEGSQIGLIAQDVEPLLPELVHESEDGYKSIDYARLTAVLVEAMKELKAENEDLRSRIDRLEGRREALR